MAKMRTSIAGILTFMNFASLTSVLAIISTTFESKDDFIYIIIVTSPHIFSFFYYYHHFASQKMNVAKLFVQQKNVVSVLKIKDGVKPMIKKKKNVVKNVAI